VTDSSDPAPTTDAKPKTRRWLWLLLTVSLAANLLVIGGAVGHVWFGPGGPQGYRLLKTLPDEQREAVREIVREARRQFGQRKREVDDAYRELETVMAKSTVDEQAIQAAAEKAFDLETDVRRDIVAGMVRVLKLVDAEDRPRFARFMTRRLFRSRGPGRPRRGWHGD